jgi:hypothetical protein
MDCNTASSRRFASPCNGAPVASVTMSWMMRNASR